LQIILHVIPLAALLTLVQDTDTNHAHQPAKRRRRGGRLLHLQ